MLGIKLYNLFFLFFVSIKLYLCMYVRIRLGLAVIPWYLASTLLPQNFRSLGQSLVSFVALIPNFLLTLVALPAYERWGPAMFVPLFILALGLAALYEWTDNLLAPVAAHSMFNALNFAMLYVLERRAG